MSADEQCFSTLGIGRELSGSLIKNVIKKRKENSQHCVFSVNIGRGRESHYSELCVF